MNGQVKALFDEARKLTPAEREELAALLLVAGESDPAIERVWAEEADRRWKEHKVSGEQRVDALAAVDDMRRLLR